MYIGLFTYFWKTIYLQQFPDKQLMRKLHSFRRTHETTIHVHMYAYAYVHTYGLSYFHVYKYEYAN